MNPSNPPELSPVIGCDPTVSAFESRLANELNNSATCERSVNGSHSVQHTASTKILCHTLLRNASPSDAFLGDEGNSTAISDRPGAADHFFEDAPSAVPADANDGQAINLNKPCGRKGIERKNFSKEVVDELQSWFYSNISHPYPNENQKEALAKSLGISHSQVSYWFVNARKRLWKPYILDQEQGSTNEAAQLEKGANLNPDRGAEAACSIGGMLHCQGDRCRTVAGALSDVSPEQAEVTAQDSILSANLCFSSAENALLVSDPQKIIVFKSKVGRPPKKKPKLGQWNPHFTESVMTKPILRVNARAASLPASDSPSLTTNISTSNAVKPDTVLSLPVDTAPLSGSGLADCLQLAQMQYVEVQQRLSNLIALAQLQHPSMLRSSAAGSVAGLHFASLQIPNQSLQFAPQMPNVVMPHLESRFLDQISLPQCLGSFQHNSLLARDQELNLALAATHSPNSAYLQQLWQIRQAQQQYIAQLASNQQLSWGGLR